MNNRNCKTVQILNYLLRYTYTLEVNNKHYHTVFVPINKDMKI